MILPIRIYGDPILRGETETISADSPELQELIDDMIETMRGAEGVGLAAPQVGRSERVFVADITNMLEPEDDRSDLPEQPMVFINPEITWEGEGESEFEEGCLSIPDIREEVIRPESIRVGYLDRHFNEQELHVDDILARVIQHELDHLHGVLFIDHISPFRRRLLRRRLRDITKGEVEADYVLHPPA